MGHCQDTHQHSGFVGDGGDQRLNVTYRLPVAELYNGIADVEQVVGDQDDIVGGIGLRRMIVKKPQNKYPSVFVKQPADPGNNVNGNGGVDDIGEDIVVHNYAMSFSNFSSSSPRVEVATRSTRVLSCSVNVCIS